MSRPIVIAHRGASGYRPEHTRAAYELAVTLGADAIEPDIVASRDGVLVLRHENEISGTTDVASRPEFAARRTTKTIDGTAHEGWFTEDFTWAELSTLRAVERLPELRGGSAAHDGEEGILRLEDLLGILDRAPRPLVLVAEIKHASYFESIGLPLDALFSDAIRGWATPSNLVVESFEQTVLGRIRDRGVPGRRVFLAEADGAPADLVAASGSAARDYADHLTTEGLAGLAEDLDGVSVDKRLLFASGEGEDVDPAAERASANGDPAGERASANVGPGGMPVPTDFVDRAHAAGLEAYTWTLRAENRFLPKTMRRGIRPGDYGDWETEFQLILRTGVDGVFTDQPDLARKTRSTL